MPAPPLTNTFEGGTDTTTITAGNSGGASGNAFQTINGACTFSTTQVFNGTLAMRAAIPGAFAATRVIWTGLGSLTSAVYFRWFWWQPSVQTAGNMQILRLLNSASAQGAWVVQNATTGLIRFFNAAGSGIAATLGTIAPSAASWVRFEARVSVTGGEVEWRLYNTPTADVASWTDRGLASGQSISTNVDAVEFGISNAGPTSVSYYYDELAVSTVDWIGPLSSPPDIEEGFAAPAGMFSPGLIEKGWWH